MYIHIDQIPPQSSLLQAKQAQLSQPFLIGEMLQPPNHLSSPSLDSLQELHVSLLLGNPEVDTVLQVEKSLDVALGYGLWRNMEEAGAGPSSGHVRPPAGTLRSATLAAATGHPCCGAGGVLQRTWKRFSLRECLFLCQTNGNDRWDITVLEACNVGRNQNYENPLSNNLEHMEYHQQVCPKAMRVFVAAHLIKLTTKTILVEEVIKKLLATWTGKDAITSTRRRGPSRRQWSGMSGSPVSLKELCLGEAAWEGRQLVQQVHFSCFSGPLTSSTGNKLILPCPYWGKTPAELLLREGLQDPMPTEMIIKSQRTLFNEVDPSFFNIGTN
ncbi:uncharacterized protein [Struthio camelus]|uniref:uncharacterized protein n=1 Tax=Struthio camelus TaxID=8801 RepID=UPI003603FA8D